MKHAMFKELLLLAASGEIDADQEAVLTRHLQACEECRSENAGLERFRMAMKAFPAGVTVDERLLREARQELRVALHAERARSSQWRFMLDRWNSEPAYRLALGAACVFAVGVLTARVVFPPGTTPEADARPHLTVAAGARPVEEETRITNVHFTDHGQSSGQVEFSFDAVTPVRMRGSIDDPAIQKVLTHAMLNEENPGVRMRAVTAVNRSGMDVLDAGIKSALIKAVQTDANVGVRKQALNAIRRLQCDGDIKTALLHVLLSDNNPGMRVAAINILDSARTEGAGLDLELRDVLKQKASTDANTYIRAKARAVLDEGIQQ